MTNPRPTLEEMERFAKVPPEEAAAVFFAMQLLTFLLDDAAPDAFAVTTKVKEYAADLRRMFGDIDKDPELRARLADITARRSEEDMYAFVDELRARWG